MIKWIKLLDTIGLTNLTDEQIALYYSLKEAKSTERVNIPNKKIVRLGGIAQPNSLKPSVGNGKTDTWLSRFFRGSL